MTSRRLYRVVILLLVCSLVAGCSRLQRDNSGPGATSKAANAGAASPNPSPCFNVYVHSDSLPETIAIEASISPVIVLGTYRGLGAAFWVTPDGIPPTNDQEVRRARLMTRITVAPGTVVQGDPKQAIKAAVAGGTLGCSTETHDAPLKLAHDVRYLFFGTGPDVKDSPKDFVFMYAAWPVSADQTVETPTEGVLALSDVLAQVATHTFVDPGGALPFPTPGPSLPTP